MRREEKIVKITRGSKVLHPLDSACGGIDRAGQAHHTIWERVAFRVSLPGHSLCDYSLTSPKKNQFCLSTARWLCSFSPWFHHSSVYSFKIMFLKALLTKGKCRISQILLTLSRKENKTLVCFLGGEAILWFIFVKWGVCGALYGVTDVISNDEPPAREHGVEGRIEPSPRGRWLTGWGWEINSRARMGLLDPKNGADCFLVTSTAMACDTFGCTVSNL